MKYFKSALLLLTVCAVLLSMIGCSNTAAGSPTGTQEPVAAVTPAEVAASGGIEAGIEDLYGTWHINSTDATIWFNDRGEDDENPTSDFTVKNFNLETLTCEPYTLNATYYPEGNAISYETFSGDIVSFTYQFGSGGSLIFTNADSGGTFTLTRGVSSGLSGNENAQTGEKTFVSDYTPGNENIYGQPNRNLASVEHGQVGIQDKWVYYFNGAALYKMNYTEGLSTAQKIGDYRAWQINVVGDWIYFNIPEANTISKVRTDGSMYQVVVTGGIDADYLYVAEHYLFYKERVKKSASETDTYLTRMDLDTGKTVRILNDAYIFWGDGDALYYIAGDGDQPTNCIDFDGNAVSRYPLRTNRFQYYGERRISGVREAYDDGSNQKLIEGATNLDAFFVEGHDLYFSMKKPTSLLSNNEVGLFGYDLDNGKLWKINGDAPKSIWCIGDGYIYYAMSDSTYVSPSYRCKPDGSGWEDIKDSMYPKY